MPLGNKSVSERLPYILSAFRNRLKDGMMCPALAARIIHCIKRLRKTHVSSYLVLVAVSGATLSSFLIFRLSNVGASLPSYLAPLPLGFLCTESHDPSVDVNRERAYLGADCVEELGGTGPGVATYLRVSSAKQVKTFSLDAQREKLNRMKDERKPSKIYWFTDPGKTGKRFDKRKLNAIMELKEKGLIRELWVADIDRLGRECRSLLIFFLNLCDGGISIRTPEKEYSITDLSSILIYVMEAYAAQQSNEARARAAVAGKIQAFRQHRWNKQVPLGYCRISENKNSWIKKNEQWKPTIKEIYTHFLEFKNVAMVFRRISASHNPILHSLTRHQIRRILSDPVYCGKPQQSKEELVDPSLMFIDLDTFQKTKELSKLIAEQHKARNLEPVRELVATYGITALQFLDHIEFRHRNCEGKIERNGTKPGNPRQQIFLCKKCPAQWTIPTESQLRRLRTACEAEETEVKRNLRLNSGYKSTSKVRHAGGTDKFQQLSLTDLLSS
jgi:DNA invertase Pin-like site-specific DNA recombinase